MSDSLTHLISHVKNGQGRKLLTVLCPHSNLVVNVLHLLCRHGLIRGFRRHPVGRPAGLNNTIQVLLKYKNSKPAILSVSRVPKGRTSRREKARPSRDGEEEGLFILSTPKGILELREAEHHHVGGVVLCHVMVS